MSPYSDAKVLDELYVDADSPDDQEILVCGCFDYFLAKIKISLFKKKKNSIFFNFYNVITQ